jgi:hypothetical protein
MVVESSGQAAKAGGKGAAYGSRILYPNARFVQKNILPALVGAMRGAWVTLILLTGALQHSAVLRHVKLAS